MYKIRDKERQYAFWKENGNNYVDTTISNGWELQICTIMQLTLNMHAIVDLPPLRV